MRQHGLIIALDQRDLPIQLRNVGHGERMHLRIELAGYA